jgi:transposase
LGNLVQFILTGGEVHDVTQAPALLNDVEPQAVLADKAYDANALIDCIESKNAKVVIPPKANRKEQRDYEQFQYRNRNLIERFFAKIKQFSTWRYPLRQTGYPFRFVYNLGGINDLVEVNVNTP